MLREGNFANLANTSNKRVKGKGRRRKMMRGGRDEDEKRVEGGGGNKKKVTRARAIS